MKLSFEIYTSKVFECKVFYTQHFAIQDPGGLLIDIVQFK
jgi:hypothetical protein